MRKTEFAIGEYYHIYNRGVDKRSIFLNQRNYQRFADSLIVFNNKTNLNGRNFNDRENFLREKPLVNIIAYCIMPNHFHLLIRQETYGGITKFMKKLGTGYSMFFNIKYERSGALFGGPFKSKLVGTDDNYLRQLFGYIHINPLDIKFPKWEDKINKSSVDMKKFIELYRYTSYPDYVGKNRIEKNIIEPKNFPDYFQNVKVDDVRKFLFNKY